MKKKICVSCNIHVKNDLNSVNLVFRLKIALSGMQYGFQGHSSDIN